MQQIQDIKSANIEGLETCAFCEYSVILSPDMKVINCLNPECQKDTCRLDDFVVLHLKFKTLILLSNVQKSIGF